MTRNLSSERILIYVIVLAAVIYGVTSVFFHRSLPESRLERLAVLYDAELYLEAEPVLRTLLQENPHDLGLHYEHIYNHYRIPERLDEDLPRDDGTIRIYYEGLLNDTGLTDIGRYGLGLISSLEEDYEAALEHFRQVSNQQQPYLNNSIGYVHWQMGNLREAEPYFMEEIGLQGNVEGAVDSLARIYQSERRMADLAALNADPAASPYLEGTQSERLLALWDSDLAGYLLMLISYAVRRIRFVALLSALAVGTMWFVFFWRIDVFEQERPLATAVAVILGAFSGLLALALSDIMLYHYPVLLGETLKGDFIHILVHIAVVEEIAKFSAVCVAVASFRRQVNEPVDYVIYGSLVALGFATLENALYFSSYGLDITLARFLMSTVMHMGTTGMVCYGWGLGIRKGKLRAAVMILLGFCAAVLFHALYDLFFITDFLPGPLAGIAVLVALVLAYGKMVANALNISPYFDPDKLQSRRLVNYSLLGIAVLLAIMIGFIYDNFALSTAIARSRVVPSTSLIVLVAYPVFTTLGEFRVIEGKVNPFLRLRGK